MGSLSGIKKTWKHTGYINLLRKPELELNTVISKSVNFQAEIEPTINRFNVQLLIHYYLVTKLSMENLKCEESNYA